MELKPFEAGRYDDENIVVRNVDNGKQELFTEEEFEIIKFLKRNEKETLLALLLPNIGIAKKHHIVICLEVLKKLKRMQIVDYFSITGKKPESSTTTIEINFQSDKISVPGSQTFATVAISIFQKAFSWLPASGILGLICALAALSMAFFPFQAVDSAVLEKPIQYWKLFLTFYLVVSGSFCFRALVQSAFVKALQREISNATVAFYGPFLTLHCSKKEINLKGFRARVQLALLGLLSPFAFSAIFTLMVYGNILSTETAFYAFSSCVAATFILACPLFPFDAAEILHVLFLRDELDERISKDLRNLFQKKGSLSREILFALFVSFVWLLAWLDSLRTFWETLAAPVVADFYYPPSIFERLGAATLMAIMIGLLILPLTIFVYSFLKEKAGGKKKRVVVQKGGLKESLTFEERMAALEKIPLFTYLNDQERLSLLNEMNPVYFKHGDFMVHQGEVGKEFFVIVKGHANAYYTDIQGRNYVLADLVEGDAFGEIALIDDVPRKATVVSDGGCICLVLKKEGFDRFAQSLGSPDRVKAMIRLTSFFRRHPLFSKLTASDQATLIDRFKFQMATMGEQVAENDDHFYVVYSGMVRVDTGDDSADTTLKADDCFGYANALNAKYFAMEGTGLLSVMRQEFHSLIWEKLVERPDLFV